MGPEELSTSPVSTQLLSATSVIIRFKNGSMSPVGSTVGSFHPLDENSLLVISLAINGASKDSVEKPLV